MIYANLGLATIVRNRLRKTNPDVAYELAKVPTGVEIVLSTPVKPVVVVPEIKSKAKPVVAGDTLKFVVRMRSMTEKWITLHEPMPNGTIWVYRPHVLAINQLPDSDNCELVIPLKVARKKGWAA
jgi:hypothetical protein